MAHRTLHDPIGALIRWLDNDEFWLADNRPKITHFPQTAEASPIYEKAGSIVGIKPAGIGDGQGQLVQGRYRSIRIDAIATGKDDWCAWNLGLFMNEAILASRGANMAPYEYPENSGVFYNTKFINIIQSGGPSPFQDAPGGKLNWRHVLYVYAVNFTAIEPVANIKAGHTLQAVTAGATVAQA